MRFRKRFFSLRTKVVLIIVLFQVILVFFFVVPIVNSQHLIVEDQLKENYRERLNVIAHFLAGEVRDRRLEALETILGVLRQSEYIEYLVAYDQGYNRLAGQDPEHLSDLGDDPGLLSTDSSEPIFREIEPHPSGFFHLEGHIYDWIKPIFVGSEPVGYLNLGVNSAATNRFVAEATQRGIWVTLTAVLIGGVIAFWVDRQMRGTLNKVIDVTSRMAAGDSSCRVEIATGDELEVLGGSFNRMADSLEQREAELVHARETLEEAVAERTSELRASQQALIQHEKMAGIGQLAAGVSHEINTPITTIITSSQFLKEDIKDEKSKKDVERIQSEALRCKEIVRNLLEFSRSASPEREVLNLNDVIEKAVALMQHEMQLQEIDFAATSSAEVFPVFGCENELVQVFFNLLQNSKDSMPNGGQLKIGAFLEAAGQVTVSVADSGSGIPLGVQSRIFDPFFTTKEIGQGTGLGLAICYRIAQSHQGEIRLSRSDSTGTTFEVRFPLYTERKV